MQNSLHARHREAYLERLAAEGAAAVVPTASPKVRSNDSDYRFRPHSDFWYLTGFDEPGACLVLLPARGEQAARTVLGMWDVARWYSQMGLMVGSVFRGTRLEARARD